MSGSFDNDMSQMFDSAVEPELRDDLEILEEYLAGVLLPPLTVGQDQAASDRWPEEREEDDLVENTTVAAAMVEETASTSFTTSTMAEIYVSQGFIPRAIDIYEEMLGENPLNEGIINRIAELKEMLPAAEVSEPIPPTAPVVAMEPELEVAASKAAATVVSAQSLTKADEPLSSPGGKDGKAVVETLELWLENICSRRQ